MILLKRTTKSCEECDNCIKKLASSKSPGPDGPMANFYKCFWEEIKLLLFHEIQEYIVKKELMTTMKQGIITLLPKPGKDKRFKTFQTYNSTEY